MRNSGALLDSGGPPSATGFHLRDGMGEAYGAPRCGSPEALNGRFLPRRKVVRFSTSPRGHGRRVSPRCAMMAPPSQTGAIQMAGGAVVHDAL